MFHARSDRRLFIGQLVSEPNASKQRTRPHAHTQITHHQKHGRCQRRHAYARAPGGNPATTNNPRNTPPTDHRQANYREGASLNQLNTLKLRDTMGARRGLATTTHAAAITKTAAATRGG